MNYGSNQTSYLGCDIAVTSLGAMSLYTAESKETKRVLVLYSEDKAHPAHELTDQGIRAAFRSNKLFDVQLYTEYWMCPGSAAPPMPVHWPITCAASIPAQRSTRSSPSTQQPWICFWARLAWLFPGVPIVACEMTRSYAESLEQLSVAKFYHRRSHRGQHSRRVR